MEKEQFDNYNGMLFCESCNKMVPKSHMNHRRVKQGYIISKCNVDMWIDRHKGFIPPESFSIEEIKIALHHFLYKDECILNDIAIDLKRELDEIIRLYSFLNIKGKHVKIRTRCAKCGKEFYKFTRAYMVSSDDYCSRDCYALDKADKVAGSNNPNYRRIKTKCTNCGKEIAVIPFDYGKINSYGDNHNFCSQKCYWDYRRIYYIGDKTHFYQHEYTDEERSAMRQSLLAQLSSSERLNTTPQKLVDEMLSSLNIEFVRERSFDYYSVDNYLPKDNGIIEVMGDYWHSNPNRYGERRLMNQVQKKQIHRDKIKYSYIKKHYNIPILYLWENDIENNARCCAELIVKYIDSLNNNYSLPDYNSFNWEYDKELKLKNNIIVPFQSQSKDMYQKYFSL